MEQTKLLNLPSKKTEKDSDRSIEIFGSFHLAGTEFAISVKYVQEVVNPPNLYNSLPLSPDFLLGLFNLRGTIIPVVDLHKLLKLPSTDVHPEKKIAILELDGHVIGLLFDRTGEIFRSNENERNNFEDQDQSVIQGVFKKSNGNRIIQILNVNVLLNLKDLPKNGERSQRSRAINHRGARKQSISFIVGEARCAFGIADVHEIIKFTSLTDTGLAKDNCIGAIDIRGMMVPVIDFAALLKYRPLASPEELLAGNRRVIVLQLGEELFGLLVESVDSIITYYEDDLKTFPSLSVERTRMFSGCISIEGTPDTLLLDIQNILSNQEIIDITHGHSSFYKSKKSDIIQMKKDKLTRRTFITFKIENIYAIPIGDIKEIVDIPKNLLKPPGLPACCQGVMNLRGEMVLIIDGRKLYGEAERTPDYASKVLVFKTATDHFGIIVDTIEAIYTFSDQDKFTLPESLYRSGNLASKDVEEAAMFKDAQGHELSLLILRIESINKRMHTFKAA